MYVLSYYAVNPRFFESVANEQDWTPLVSCIPPYLGLLALHAVHELAHLFIAQRDNIEVGRPIPVPSLQLGLFGCITELRDFPPNRTSLLDFSLSGPLTGIAVSISLLLFGILSTSHATQDALSHYPYIPVAFMKGSLVVGSLVSLISPEVAALPLSQQVPMHPTFLLGLTGLICNSLNMIPIGRLDGGRAYTAIFGSGKSSRASLVFLLLLTVVALFGGAPVYTSWWLLVVAFQRRQDIPVRDEVTSVDDARVYTFLGTLIFCFLTLTPYPGGNGFL